MYKVYAYYSSAMFVYFNRLLFKSIFPFLFLHFITFLPFFLLLSPSLSLLVRFPTFFSFHSTRPSFPTPLFIPTSSFPPIASSIIFPLLFFRSLYYLLASFPSNPLFLSYSSINPTPSFFYPLILSYHSISILSLLSILPLHSFLSFLPLHLFLSLFSVIPLFSFLSLLFFLPFFSSYPSFTCSPPSLPLPHFYSPPSFPPFLPFLPLYSFLPYIHSCLPLLYLLDSFSPHLPLLFVASAFVLPSPSLPLLLSLSHPLSSLSPSPFHSLSLIISFAFFHRPPLLSSILFLPASSLPLFLSLSVSHSLSFSLSHPPSHPTERYFSLSFSSLSLFFFHSFYFYPSLPPSLSYFPISLSPIIVLCTLHNTVIYNFT